MSSNHGPKIGLLDIETAPVVGNFWALFDQTIGLNQINTEWSILSYAFKPLGEGAAIQYKDTSKELDVRNDYRLCKELWDILHDYDIIIAQNGKRFDLRKIRARMLMHGFPPPAPIKVADTLLMARQVAAFTSNKLEWLAKYLSDIPKQTHREFPGFELWKECLAGNAKAWAAMKSYNIDDILSMEQVYLRLRPWVAGHANVAVYQDAEHVMCPVCGSSDMKEDGHSYTQVGKYLRYQCGGCGAWGRSRYTINSLAKRKALLTN